MIAQLALLGGSDPLVTTRYFNLLLWAVTAYAGYILCHALGADIDSGGGGGGGGAVRQDKQAG